MVGHHSPIAPSSANVWVHCTGQPRMAQDFPEPESDDHKEGDAAHWVASEILNSFKNEGGLLLAASHFVGQVAPNGVIITEDIYRGARVYVDDILGVCNTRGGLSELMVEQQVAAPMTVHPMSYGTVDAALYLPEQHALFLWDFKFGFLDVPAFENWQLTNYYACLAERFGIDGLQDQRVSVVLSVVQPRCFNGDEGPVKRWQLIGSDLRGYVNRLRAQAETAMSGNGQLVSGKHCRYCPARHGCKSARDAALAGFEYTNQPVPEHLTDDALSFELAVLEQAEAAIKYRKEALEEEGLRRAQAGHKIFGRKVTFGRGRRQFVPGRERAVDLVADAVGVSSWEEPKRCTVAEFERRLENKGYSKAQVGEMLNGLYETPARGLRLVKDDGTEARRIFSQQER